MRKLKHFKLVNEYQNPNDFFDIWKICLDLGDIDESNLRKKAEEKVKELSLEDKGVIDLYIHSRYMNIEEVKFCNKMCKFNSNDRYLYSQGYTDACDYYEKELERLNNEIMDDGK